MDGSAGVASRITFGFGRGQHQRLLAAARHDAEEVDRGEAVGVEEAVPRPRSPPAPPAAPRNQARACRPFVDEIAVGEHRRLRACRWCRRRTAERPRSHGRRLAPGVVGGTERTSSRKNDASVSAGTRGRSPRRDWTKRASVRAGHGGPPSRRRRSRGGRGSRRGSPAGAGRTGRGARASRMPESSSCWRISRATYIGFMLTGIAPMRRAP